MAATHMPHRCGRRVWENCLRRSWPRQSSIRCGTRAKPTLRVCGTKVCPPPTNGMRAWCTASRDPRRIPTWPRRCGRPSKSPHPKRPIRNSWASSSSSAYCPRKDRAPPSSVRRLGVAQPEFLHHRRREISPPCPLDQLLENATGVVDLVRRDIPAGDCISELVLIEDLEPSIRCDPKVEEEVDNGLKRCRISVLPTHRLEDVGIVASPGSVRTVDAADVVGLVL